MTFGAVGHSAACLISDNSPSSAKHIADDNEVFWALANGYAPTISSIPTRLEFLRGFLRSKFSADRFCHYHHQIEIIITATSSSSNQRDLERVVSMLKNDDALKYFALFTELLQLETFAGLA